MWKRIGAGSAVPAATAFAIGMSGGSHALAQYQPPSGWYLDIGAAGIQAPDFEGSRDRAFTVEPLVSLGRHGFAVRFSSRNDNISLGLIDSGGIRAGLAGKLVLPRRSSHEDLQGLESVPLGLEAGAFAEIYPDDWVRVRGEVRRGIRSHDGVVAEIAVDAFMDVAPTVRISAGPRISYASSGYFDAYYGVSAGEAEASGLSQYEPGSGLRAIGAGGAVTWQTTERLATTVFAEYERLMGPAAGSSIVSERGTRDQLTLGAAATYRFNLGF